LEGYKRVRSKPFPSRKLPKRVRLKEHPNFFKRYARWFTLIGAVIVLGAFVAREGYREDFKDLASAISDQEFRNDVRQQLQLIRGLLEQPHTTDTSHGTSVYGRGDVYLWKYIFTENEIGILETFNTGLPINEDEATVLAGLSKRLSTHSPREVYDLLEQSASQVKLEKAEHDLNEIEGDALHEFSHLQGIAEAQESIAKRNYSIANRASWVFYALGLVLSVCGKLYGVDTIDGE
jgi:hypothetical protein